MGCVLKVAASLQTCLKKCILIFFPPSFLNTVPVQHTRNGDCSSHNFFIEHVTVLNLDQTFQLSFNDHRFVQLQDKRPGAKLYSKLYYSVRSW